MTRGRLEFSFHQCLGKGGFGEVYLATLRRSGGLKQRVAVKVLKTGLPDEGEAVRRLRDEAVMLATLNHPAILRVHDLCRVSGRIALVMEYIEGIDLARCAKAGRLLPPRVVVGAIGEVASALDSAWNTISPETGRPLHLIHRDLKPENIRISVHGQIKLLDFGIARTTEMIRHAHTQAGDLPFTPGYAAPESFVLGEQGPASDVYALGVTMYRLLVGERLYEGMDIASQVNVAVRPERYGPWVQERLAKVPTRGNLRGLVQTLVAYEAEDRMSAAQLHEACEQLADRLDGPTLSRWARSVKFPPPRDIEGASLTGRTLPDDGLVTDVGEAAGPVPFGPPLGREPSPDPTPRRGRASDSGSDVTPRRARSEEPSPPRAQMPDVRSSLDPSPSRSRRPEPPPLPAALQSASPSESLPGQVVASHAATGRSSMGTPPPPPFDAAASLSRSGSRGTPAHDLSRKVTPPPPPALSSPTVIPMSEDDGPGTPVPPPPPARVSSPLPPPRSTGPGRPPRTTGPSGPTPLAFDPQRLNSADETPSKSILSTTLYHDGPDLPEEQPPNPIVRALLIVGGLALVVVVGVLGIAVGVVLMVLSGS